MNRRQFLILILALAVIGGTGLALFWQDIRAWRMKDPEMGARLLPGLPLNEVAQIRLQDAKDRVTLSLKGEHWVVDERAGYTANFQEIRDLLLKIAELKIVQVEKVGPSLLPRLELAEPGKGEGAGTLIEFRDKAGKTLGRAILGKKVLKKDPLNPLPIAQEGVPAGRYIVVSGGAQSVAVVSDPLNSAEAKPGRWLAKDFFKAERIRTLTAAGGAAQWRITRDQEWGQWKFAAGGGALDASAAVGAVNALASLGFSDVAVDVKPDALAKPTVFTAETFDKLIYAIRIARRPGAEDYLLAFTVSGEPPRARVPEKNEKAADKERRDKEFAENLKKLEARIKAEKSLGKWVYVMPRPALAPLLKERAQMIAAKKKGGPAPAVSMGHP
ncbi:MAG: DUF4340 domain-containing protein [Betaproteobacteria bacterium]|nr:DUF4340 domain-containing protein [Betaproteobacteria bacterium]